MKLRNRLKRNYQNKKMPNYNNLTPEEIAKIFKIEYVGGIRYKCPWCEEKVLIIEPDGQYICSGCNLKGHAFDKLAVDLYGSGSDQWFLKQLKRIRNDQSEI